VDKAVNSNLIAEISVTFGEGEAKEHISGVLLVAALLIYVSKGDGDMSTQEIDEMLLLMTSHLSISNAEALQSLRQAIMMLSDDQQAAVKLHSIGQELSPDQRRHLLQLMFTIAGVDGAHHAGELGSISMAASVLGLSQSEVKRARKAAN